MIAAIITIFALFILVGLCLAALAGAMYVIHYVKNHDDPSQ